MQFSNSFISPEFRTRSDGLSPEIVSGVHAFLERNGVAGRPPTREERRERPSYIQHWPAVADGAYTVQEVNAVEC